MAVTAFWYAKSFINAFTQAMPLDWDTNAIKCSLHTNTYTPNQDTHEDVVDLTNEHAASGGYSTGGATLTTKTMVNTLNVVKFTSDNVSWATSTITARRAAFRDSVGGATDATRPLLWWIDFGADVSSTGGTFQITQDAAGWATITPADAAGFPA